VKLRCQRSFPPPVLFPDKREALAEELLNRNRKQKKLKIGLPSGSGKCRFSVSGKVLAGKKKYEYGENYRFMNNKG